MTIIIKKKKKINNNNSMTKEGNTDKKHALKTDIKKRLKERR